MTTGNTLTINGDSQFNNGCTIVIETGAFLIINGALTNSNNSNGITIDGTLTVNGAFTGGNGSTIEGDGDLSATSISTTGSGEVFGSPDECTGGCVADEGGGVLPVELIDFSVNGVDGGSLITWSTASELNNDYFIVEFAVNGQDFSEIAIVPGVGTTSEEQNYQYMDYGNEVGYYRLIQVDFDGTQTDLGTLHVAADMNLEKASLFPNPSPDGGFKLKTTTASEPILITVMDVYGRELYTVNTITNVDGTATISSADHALPTGMYIVTSSAIQGYEGLRLIVK